MNEFKRSSSTNFRASIKPREYPYFGISSVAHLNNPHDETYMDNKSIYELPRKSMYEKTIGGKNQIFKNKVIDFIVLPSVVKRKALKRQSTRERTLTKSPLVAKQSINTNLRSMDAKAMQS